MKNTIIVLIAFCIFTSLSCKKEEKTTSTENVKYEYLSLVAEDSIVSLNEYVKIHAIANGDDLEYIWTYSAGAIVGSGKDVEWSVCHSGVFIIDCEIMDNHGNKEKKSINIYAK